MNTHPMNTRREKIKGIILAGGKGTRLGDMTKAVSKQLLPVFNKPMVYYPLSLLLRAGCKEIAIISTPHHLPLYQELLEDGVQFDVEFTYIKQEHPEGLAQAYILCENFLDSHNSMMVLGDNIFFGGEVNNFIKLGCRMLDTVTTCMISGYNVHNPSQYGVARIAEQSVDACQYVHPLLAMFEKPEIPPSNLAVPGLYFMDRTAPDKAKRLKPSVRGELEIAALIESYIDESVDAKSSKYHPLCYKLGNDTWWFDAGTPKDLLDAANFVAAAERRQSLPVCDPHTERCIL